MHYLWFIWKKGVYTHGNVVLNLFFGMFSGSFATSHGYFSPYNNVWNVMFINIYYILWSTNFLAMKTRQCCSSREKLVQEVMSRILWRWIYLLFSLKKITVFYIIPNVTRQYRFFGETVNKLWASLDKLLLLNDI